MRQLEIDPSMIRRKPSSERKMNQQITYGTGFGSALAMAISFNVNHSIGWAILHGIFSWFYVIYYWIWK